MFEVGSFFFFGEDKQWMDRTFEVCETFQVTSWIVQGLTIDQ